MAETESQADAIEPNTNGFDTDNMRPSKPAPSSTLDNRVPDGAVNHVIFKSVVKIFVVRCSPNYSRPWQMSSQSHSSSTGFVISGRRILCNAHGVTHARSIRLRKHGDSKKYDAVIQHIGHECDLAILTVESDRFWRNLQPLSFDYKTPKLQDIVVVVGYPVGGDQVCVTKGVVSRVGFVSYSHALENLFSLQIDAAINPGNSGGPTIMNNKVVGVAFETQLNTQNIGYCIPVRVVMHFLDDIEQHESYTNFPKLGFRWQKIESLSLRKYFEMVDFDYDPHGDDDDEEEEEKDDKKEAEETSMNAVEVEKQTNKKPMDGILINSVYPLTDCSEKLKENDVLLEIDGTSIGEDGTIKYPFPADGVSRINYTYITSNKFCGDTVKLTILREGKVMHIDVIVNIIDYLVPIVLYDRPVTYYIFGGFVFLPLSRPYLRSEYGSKWSSKCAVRLKDLYFNGYKQERDEEVVILSRVLASDLNAGYHKFTNLMLEKANGVEIKNVKQLIAVIEETVENKSSRYIHFLFENNITMVLEVDSAINGMPKIMKEHKIKYDRSANLRPTADGQENLSDVELFDVKVLAKKKQKLERKVNVDAASKVKDANKAMQLIDDITRIFAADDEDENDKY